MKNRGGGIEISSRSSRGPSQCTAIPDDAFVPSFLRSLPLAGEALGYARELHRGQRRSSDEAPFILHPLEVAALLSLSGHAEAVVAAGVLHDAVEDTGADVGDITRRFGPEVGALVGAMTEDPRIECYEERKAALRRQISEFGDGATAVYAADKVAKVRELRAQAGCDADLMRREEVRRKLEHYEQSLAMLEDATPEHPLVRMLRFELEALRALPPREAR